jgi:hypothetical protein
MRRGRVKIPYDRETIDEQNIERFEMTKDGKIRFSHPEGTKDDIFWAFALGLAGKLEQPASGSFIKL